MLSLTDLESAAELVHRDLSGTPQLQWPLLSQRAGCEVWVKHENHNPTGAFKVRGGLVYLAWLRGQAPEVRGVITATRGNHGQSIGFAAARSGLSATIVVPHGNSREKNAAMRSLGVELIEHGRDFQESAEFAVALAAERGLHRVPSFHRMLVAGVASYGLELFRGTPELDAVYVPIGMGSGICGTMAARDALGLRTRIVGVVAANAPMMALSFAQRAPVSTATADTIADGVACRVPDPEALELVLKGVDRIVTVPEGQIASAMRHYFTDTHNVAEGAGAIGLAALLAEKEAMRGKRVGLVLSGGNVDRSVYGRVLDEE